MSYPGGALSVAIVNIATAGDHVIIPGLTGGVFIRRVLLTLDDKSTIQFKAGDRVLSGLMPLDYLAMGFSDQWYYAADVNEPFIISLGDDIQTGGTVWYQQGP